MKNIIETAMENADFSTLITAIKKAELVETLSGKGPFTVFAPTNEAFAKIPKTTLDEALSDKNQLTDILTYHVLNGKIMAEDIMYMKMAKTLQGKNISINTDNGVTVDKAKVTKTDIACSNGVIHVIDTVLMP